MRPDHYAQPISNSCEVDTLFSTDESPPATAGIFFGKRIYADHMFVRLGDIAFRAMNGSIADLTNCRVIERWRKAAWQLQAGFRSCRCVFRIALIHEAIHIAESFAGSRFHAGLLDSRLFAEELCDRTNCVWAGNATAWST